MFYKIAIHNGYLRHYTYIFCFSINIQYLLSVLLHISFHIYIYIYIYILYIYIFPQHFLFQVFFFFLVSRLSEEFTFCMFFVHSFIIIIIIDFIITLIIFIIFISYSCYFLSYVVFVNSQVIISQLAETLLMTYSSALKLNMKAFLTVSPFIHRAKIHFKFLYPLMSLA